jgi:subtilisin family serine protease
MSQVTAKSALAALALLAAAACQDPGTPQAAGPLAPSDGPALDRREDADDERATFGEGATAQEIPGQYIVVFRDEVGDPEAKAKEKESKLRSGKKLKQIYKAALKGFAGELTPEDVAALRADPEVALVEPDQVVELSVVQSGATWGIDRIDQSTLPLSGTFGYNTTASTVNAYIIDTGINTGHGQFGGRASNPYDATGGNGVDCNGHGTHVAGTVGGATYGVAKGARLYGVRVFTCSGSSANSIILAGIDWVRINHKKPAVANLSLGGGYSAATNTAVTNLANAGVFVAVAAGNSNANACNTSPASAPVVTTVASSTRTDAKSSFSNYGSCVDLYAPGSSITSAWIGSTSATNTISGTSMAAPHVAGAAALYKATYGDASQGTVNKWLVDNSSLNRITGNVSGTPNRLLFKKSL